MAVPSVEIVGPPGGVRCGEKICGTVNVGVEAPCEGRRLVVALRYRGRGDGPNQHVRHENDVETSQLFAGDWAPGTYSYPFSLTAPDACNYTGAILAIEWLVRAGVGPVGDARFDVADERALALEPAEITAADRARQEDAEIVRREPARLSAGCLGTAVALVLVGLLLAWLGRDHDAALPGLVAAVAGVALLAIMFRQRLIDRKVATTEFRIGAAVAWPGTELPCSVTLQPKVPLRIESATLTLEALEHVKKFTGLYRSTGPVHTHSVLLDRRSIDLPPGPLPAGVPVRLAGWLVFPANAVCSMDFDNELKFKWRAELRLKIEGCPDWFDVEPITVLPRVPDVTPS